MTEERVHTPKIVARATSKGGVWTAVMRETDGYDWHVDVFKHGKPVGGSWRPWIYFSSTQAAFEDMKRLVRTGWDLELELVTEEEAGSGTDN